MRSLLSVPTVVLYHVGEFNDVLPLLVLLTEFKGLLLQKKGCIVVGKRNFRNRFDETWYKK